MGDQEEKCLSTFENRSKKTHTTPNMTEDETIETCQSMTTHLYNIPTPPRHPREGDRKKVSYILGYPPRGSKNVSYPPQAPSKLVKQGGGQKNVT